MVSEDVLVANRRSPNICRKCAADMDFDVISLFTQLTADVLSQWVPICLCLMFGVVNSTTRNINTIPANSKLFILVSTLGLISMTNLCSISSGHSTCQMINLYGPVPGVNTPPAPCLQASLYHTIFGMFATSCLTDIG